MDLSALLQEGLKFHQSGRLEDARACYQRILAVDSKHFDALQLSATLEMQHGEYKSALQLFETALTVKRNYPPIYMNMGLAFKRDGNQQQALICYNEAIRLDAQYSDAYNNRGLLLYELNHHDRAVEDFNQAIRLKSDFAEAYSNRGLALHRLNRFDEAISSYYDAIRIRPGFLKSYINLGNCYLGLRRFSEAVVIYNFCISNDYINFEIYNNRGIALFGLKKYDEALESYSEGLRLNPKYHEAFCNRGMLYHTLLRFDEAVADFNQAIRLKSDFAEAYSNRGLALHRLNRFDEAISSYYDAIRIRPRYAAAYKNAGWMLHEQKKFDDALKLYSYALHLNSTDYGAAFHKSITLLQIGDYRYGWELYESRILRKSEDYGQDLGGVPWRTADSVSSLRLLVFAEQGLGDSIQFVRYLPMVVALGANVIFLVQRPLVSLFKSMNLPVTLVAKGDPLPEFDAHCPLMSLPYVFRTTVETIPAQVPYVFADDVKIRFWTSKVGEKGRLKVGLVWNGGFRPNQPEVWSVNERRNIPIALFSEFLQHPGVDFFSLQKGDPAESEIRGKEHEFWSQGNFYNFTDELFDFSDTAALIAALDLVISVDTSTAHLAGALGKPTWILNRYDTCWRWFEDREDSPWYPTVRLFRQDERRDWGVVLSEVRDSLSALLCHETRSVS